MYSLFISLSLILIMLHILSVTFRSDVNALQRITCILLTNILSIIWTFVTDWSRYCCCCCCIASNRIWYLMRQSWIMNLTNVFSLNLFRCTRWGRATGYGSNRTRNFQWWVRWRKQQKSYTEKLICKELDIFFRIATDKIYSFLGGFRIIVRNHSNLI